MSHDKLIIRVTACLCIAALEMTAMLKGINGATFGIATAAIGAIAGTTITPLVNLFKTKNPPE